jgi:hypothetical protein
MFTSDPDEAWKNFYLEYGPAMFAWQLLESELATLFAIVCKIQPAVAIQIFYSATSFNARTDIFSAALTASKADQTAIEFAHLLIKKSKQYSEFRNKFAHDQPLLYQHGLGPGLGANFEIILVHGKGQFQSDAVKKRYRDLATTVPQIKKAGAAFRDLANIIRDFWGDLTMQQPPSLDKLRARLLVLPTLRLPTAPIPPIARPKRPRSPSAG